MSSTSYSYPLISGHHPAVLQRSFHAASSSRLSNGEPRVPRSPPPRAPATWPAHPSVHSEK